MRFRFIEDRHADYPVTDDHVRRARRLICWLLCLAGAPGEPASRRAVSALLRRLGLVKRSRPPWNRHVCAMSSG
jgi:hypothetical protein